MTVETIQRVKVMRHKAYFLKLRDVLQGNGKEGTTEYERYIDLPSIIRVNTKWSLYQLCYFADDDQLLAYALNKYDEGKFYEVSKLPQKVKAELINLVENTFLTNRNADK